MSDTEVAAAPVNEAQSTDKGPRDTTNLQEDRAKKVAEQAETPEAVAGEGLEDAEDTAEGDDTASPDNPEPKKRKSGIQKRLDELTIARRTSEARAEQLERELAAERKSRETQPAKPEPVVQDGQKTLADFDFDPEQFQRYLAREEAKNILAEERTREQQTKEENRKQETVSKFETRAAALKVDRPDYVEVAHQNPLAQFYQPDVVEFLYESDIGPELAYHLGKNPAEIDAILRMGTPTERTRALSRIEARLDAVPATPTPKTFTQAPAPVKPLQGNAPVKKTLEELTTPEFMAERKRQLAAKK